MTALPAMTALPRIAAVLLAISVLVGCGRQAPEHAIVVPQDDRVRIPLATINDGGVHFFTFKHDGKNVNFFVRTDGSGQLQAHFDACYSCYKYRMGYIHEGNQVVCVACRIGYDLADVVWDYVGACAPINLKSRIEGQDMVIKRSWLVKGSRFF